MPVPIFHFDGDGGKGDNDGNGKSKEVIRYSRRKKQGIQKQNPHSHEPLQNSTSKPPSKIGNVIISHSFTSISKDLNLN